MTKSFRERSGNEREVVLTKPEDLAFVKQLGKTVTEWLAGTEPELLLPSVRGHMGMAGCALRGHGCLCTQWAGT